MTDCKYCNNNCAGTFDYSCFKCRERSLMMEPCKVLRDYMAQSMWRYGVVPDWKREPHCGCKSSCKRRQLTKKELRIN
jgi:hypothetical protein